MNSESDIEIDEKAIKRLMRKIILLEKRNLQTKEYSSGQIVKKIQHMIQEEAEWY
jgi:hypothetical protein